MPNLFQDKSILPMLISHEVKPYDDEDSIFELKLDGIRCIAYIGQKSLSLRNKRNKDVTEIYPELADIMTSTKDTVILDGEIIVLKNGKPDFFSLQKRSLMSDPFKIRIASQRLPVHYVAFDILYRNDTDLTKLPLLQRKEILSKCIKENKSISLSRFIFKNGIQFFHLVKENSLEGIVGKKKNSLYFFGKRTKDWQKIKAMVDEDLIILGYQQDEEGKLKDLLLGYYNSSYQLCYRGKVFLGISAKEKELILEFAKNNRLSLPTVEGFSNVIWMKPELVGTAHYMQQTKAKSMRQPVWKGLRFDKEAKDCIREI